MGCCFSNEEEDYGGPTDRTPLLHDSTSNRGAGNTTSGGQPIPNSLSASSHMNKNDEESALNQILQRTANDVIDVTYVEPHSLERSELMGRTRDYQAQVTICVLYMYRCVQVTIIMI